METKRFFQYESFINASVISCRFISIPMLWVYGHYNSFTLIARGSTGIRGLQILTYKVDPRAVRVKVFGVNKRSIRYAYGTAF